MIREEEFGFVLRCTGCLAFVSLSQQEQSDPEARIGRKELMAVLHHECDSYRDTAKAAAAIKRKRRAARQAAAAREGSG